MPCLQRKKKPKVTIFFRGCKNVFKTVHIFWPKNWRKKPKIEEYLQNFLSKCEDAKLNGLERESSEGKRKKKKKRKCFLLLFGTFMTNYFSGHTEREGDFFLRRTQNSRKFIIITYKFFMYYKKPTIFFRESLSFPSASSSSSWSASPSTSGCHISSKKQVGEKQ